MANNFLTYKFYAFLTNPGAAPGVDRRYKTYMPMTYDDIYFLPSSMSYDDAFNSLLIEGKTPEEAEKLLKDKDGYYIPPASNYNVIHSYLGASSQLYNGIVVVDGVEVKFNGSAILQSGVTWQFDYDSVTAIVDTSDTGFGQIMDESIVEISLQYAKTAVPWIYYGTNRYDLATRLGREPTGMGGAQPSVVPADAIQIISRIDGDVSPIAFGGNIIPFVSAAVSFGFGAAMKDIWTLWDILDGRLNDDGTERVAIRSSTLFNASSFSITGGFGGITNLVTFAQTGWATESYRNIHSRTMDYQLETFHDNKLIENTTFVMMCDASKHTPLLNDHGYRLIGEAVDGFSYSFIDFHTCKFEFWVFYGNQEEEAIVEFVGRTSYQAEDDEENIPKGQVLEFFDDIASRMSGDEDNNVENQFTRSFKNPFKKIHNNETDRGIFKYIFTQDMQTYKTNNDEGLDPRNISYKSVFLSFFNFGKLDIPPTDIAYWEEAIESREWTNTFPESVESGDITLPDGSTTTYSTGNLSYEGAVYNESTDVSDGSLEIPSPIPSYPNSMKAKDWYLEMSEFVLGVGNSTLLYGWDGFECFVLDFLSVLRGESVDFDDLTEGDGFVSSKRIVEQINKMTTPFSFVANGSTLPSDVKHAVTDYLLTLYSNKENSNQFRYWRKTVPIGEMYRASGTIDGEVSMFNGDYYFQMKIGDDENNKIWVYIERGARSNMASSSFEDVFEIQGRLFYEDYFKTINLDPFMDFTTHEGALLWYRLSENALKFLYYKKPNTQADGLPIIIVRSNEILTPGGDYIPPEIFNTDDGYYDDGATQGFVIDKINDYVFNKTLEFDPLSDVEKYPDGYIQLGRGERIRCMDSGDVDVIIEDLTFTMEIPDDRGDYQYEVWYNNKDRSGPFKLWDFHSEVAKLSENNTASIRLSGYYKLSCEEGLEGDNKTFYVKYSYSKKQIEGAIGEVVLSYNFVWNPNIFDVVSVWRNEEKIGTDLVFPGKYTIIPAEGKIVFDEPVNTDLEFIQIEFINVAELSKEEIGERKYNVTKYGNGLELRRSEDGIANAGEGSPKISSIKANAGKKDSVERVESVYYHTSRGNSTHYIAPAYGFYYLAGDGSWFMTPDEARELAGDLASPYFYVDRVLELSDPHRRVDKSSDTLVSIDRIYGNVSSRAQMLVYTRTSLESIDREIKKIQKTSVHRSPITQKHTLVYIDNEILNQKSSYANFASKDDRYEHGDQKGQKKYTIEGTEDSFFRDNFRFSNPIRSWKTVYPTSPLFIGNNEEAVFDIESNTGELVSLSVKSSTLNTGNLLNAEPFELYASNSLSGDNFYPFGYETFSGDQVAKRFSAYGTKADDNARSFIFLPDTREVSRLKIRKPVNSEGEFISEAGNITEVIGSYVGKYMKGFCPNLDEASNGKMMLYYLDEESKNIMLYASHNRGYEWNRPNVDSGTLKDGEPIIVYGNNVGLGNLMSVHDGINKFNNLFFYDYNNSAIDMIMFPTERSMNIQIGLGESSEEVVAPPDGKGFDPLVVKTWEGYFLGGNNVRRVLSTTSDNFGTTIDKRGVFWVTFSTPQAALKVMYNPKLSRANEGDGTDWINSGVNLIDNGTISEEEGEGAGTMLYNALVGKVITSINLSFNNIKDLLYVFLTTDDRQLVLFPVSGSLLAINEKIQKQENVKENQKKINEIKPILVLGSASNFSGVEDYIILDNPFLSSNYKIDAQSLSISWSSEGLCTIFYYDENLEVKAIKANNLTYWSDHNNV